MAITMNRTKAETHINTVGGDQMAISILKELEPKEVAQDFYIGETHIRIATDYCRPKEEVPKILRKIAKDALIALNRKTTSQ